MLILINISVYSTNIFVIIFVNFDLNILLKIRPLMMNLELLCSFYATCENTMHILYFC